tara:strand:- start:1298 stop:1756 length:459 start_codon:yes stop_codon:yes gene_type:complete
MVLDQECLQRLAENLYLEEGQRAEKDFLLKKSMTKLESLKKSSHFQTVLKHRVVNSDLFSIYRTKNFIKKTREKKKLYISFVMKKKIGNAVKRNRIKRKLKSIVQKLLKMNSLINLNYTYIIFGKEKAYKEHHNSLFEKMKKSFKRIDSVKL